MDSPTTSNRSLATRIFFSPEERRLRAGWRLLCQFLLLGLFASIAYFFLFPLLLEGGAYWLVDELIRLLTISIPVYLARRFLDRQSFVSLGLAWNSRAVRDVLAGFLIGGISMTMIFLFERAMGWLRVDDFAWQVDTLTSVLAGVAIMFLIFAMTAWSEELQARLLATEPGRRDKPALGIHPIFPTCEQKTQTIRPDQADHEEDDQRGSGRQGRDEESQQDCQRDGYRVQ